METASPQVIWRSNQPTRIPHDRVAAAALTVAKLNTENPSPEWRALITNAERDRTVQEVWAPLQWTKEDCEKLRRDPSAGRRVQRGQDLNEDDWQSLLGTLSTDYVLVITADVETLADPDKRRLVVLVKAPLLVSAKRGAE